MKELKTSVLSKEQIQKISDTLDKYESKCFENYRKKTGWAYSSCRKSASLFWFDHDAYIIMNKDFKKIYKEIDKIVGDV